MVNYSKLTKKELIALLKEKEGNKSVKKPKKSKIPQELRGYQPTSKHEKPIEKKVRTPGKKTTYTEKELKQALKLRSQGFSIRNIAEKTGISKSVVGRLTKQPDVILQKKSVEATLKRIKKADKEVYHSKKIKKPLTQKEVEAKMKKVLAKFQKEPETYGKLRMKFDDESGYYWAYE